MMTTLDRGNETRARILAAARRLFAERGYAATSLADIASAVGLTKTAVAYHFNPKGRIAAELIAPAADDMLALLGTDFGGDRRAFAEALVGFSTRHRTVIRLMIEDVGLADDARPAPSARSSAPSATSSTPGSRAPIRPPPSAYAPGPSSARSSAS